MSLLDILIISAGALAVLVYGFFAVRKEIKRKNRYKQLIAEGMSPAKAKIIVDGEIKYKKGKKEKEESSDKIFEE